MSGDDQDRPRAVSRDGADVAQAAFSLESARTIEALEEENRRRRKAEEELRASLDEALDLYDRAPCGLLSLDGNGVFVRINDTALGWLGYTREEVVGKMPFADLLQPANRDAFEKSFAILRERGWVRDAMYELIRKDGSTLPVLKSATATLGPDGRYVRSRASLYVISERRRAGHSLRERDRFLQRVMDATPDAIYVYDLVGQRFIFGFREISAMLGYTAEQIAAMGESALWKRLHPEDRALAPERRARYETASDDEVFETDFRMRHARGEWRWLRSRSVVFERAEDGRPTEVLAVVSDVTLSKLAEEALTESERFYRTLIETLPVGIALTDERGRVTFASSSCREIFGIGTDAEVAGSRIQDFVAPEFIEKKEARRRMRRMVLEPEEIRLVRKDRTPFWADVSSAPLFAASGRFNGNIVVIEDVSARRRDQEELRRFSERLQLLSRRVVEVQEEERRRLALELHDEFGQSLTAILYRLQAVKNLQPRDAIDVIDETIGIADDTIRAIRNLSLDLRPAMLEEAGLPATLRWYVDRQVQSERLHVDLNVSSSTAHLPPGLRNACFRVVQEALTNVVRHSQARNVLVTVATSGEYVELLVKDDGKGFDPPEARRRAHTGHSIGILGMQERVELLGGVLDFDSAPGRGTAVKARFPLTPSNYSGGRP